jgi:hypothetical protein
VKLIRVSKEEIVMTLQTSNGYRGNLERLRRKRFANSLVQTQRRGERMKGKRERRTQMDRGYPLSGCICV